MRVLRTEMYFPKEQIVDLYTFHTSHAENPGLGFAWLHTGGDTGGFDERLLEMPALFRDEHVVEIFLDYVLRGYERRLPFQLFMQTYIGSRLPANPEMVASVMNGEIVIEGSPPQAITFRSLLAKAPAGVAIGTLVGMTAAGDVGMLALLTVPGGIIVCSSAIGISKALEKGLNKMVERLMEDTEHR
jgi:hypothetical protein